MEFKSIPQPTALPSDEICAKLGRLVEIYHPGYTPPKPLVFVRASDNGGVYYNVPYYICCIIANNIWTAGEGQDEQDKEEPFLSKSEDPSQPRYIVPASKVMPAGKYYFHVPQYQKKPPYPIIPQFKLWKFPHNKLPKPWEDLRKAYNPFVSPTRNAAYDAIRQPCTLSARIGALEEAHMVPKSAQEWLAINNMRDYIQIGKAQAVHVSTDNHFFLSNEIHFLFDESIFTLVPKPYPNPSGNYKLTSHVLKSLGKSADSDVEMITLYHNVPCLPLEHIPVELMFARFAWSIFNNGIIALFNDDIRRKHRFSVLVPEKSGDGAAPLIEKMLTLKNFKPPQSKATGVGEKRDASHLEAGDEEHEEPIDDDLVYSVRTGEFVPYDDPREPGDHGANRYRYDNSDDSSDVCSKRSRSSFHSDSESECDSELVWHSEGADQSETDESEAEEQSGDNKNMLETEQHTPDLSSSIISSGSSDPSLSPDEDYMLPQTSSRSNYSPSKDPYNMYKDVRSK